MISPDRVVMVAVGAKSGGATPPLRGARSSVGPFTPTDDLGRRDTSSNASIALASTCERRSPPAPRQSPGGPLGDGLSMLVAEGDDGAAAWAREAEIDRQRAREERRRSIARGTIVPAERARLVEPLSVRGAKYLPIDAEGARVARRDITNGRP